MKSVKQLENELAVARMQEQEERLRVTALTVPVWRFTLLPTKKDTWDRVYDDTIVRYRLEGVIVNREECLAAGHPDHALHQGGMTYLYNTGNNRLVMATGGGMLFLSDNGFGGRRDTMSLLRVMRQLEEFLEVNPKGGDVTALMVAYLKKTGWS